MASAVNQQLREEAGPASSRSLPRSSGSRQDPLRSLATRVTTKLEEGDYRGAVRLACSEDSIAVLDEETVAALQSKHPPPHPETCIPPAPNSFTLDPPLLEEEVARAIHSFLNGSAGDPDGLRPQHLKDLIGASAERGVRSSSLPLPTLLTWWSMGGLLQQCVLPFLEPH